MLDLLTADREPVVHGGVDFDSIEWDRVRRLTFVPFLADGRCALIPAGGRLALPSGQVLAGEDPVLDTGLRVPLVTAGFRRQGLHPFAAEGDHVYVWCEGDDRYRGSRPHAEVDLWKGPAEEAARRLRAAGDEHAATVVEAADRARRSLGEEDLYRDWQRVMEASYLRATLLDLVPATRLGEMLTYQLDHLVAAGGRLLASHYVPADDRSRHPAEVLSRLGVRVDGVTGPGDNAGRAVPPTAWVQRR